MEESDTEGEGGVQGGGQSSAGGKEQADGLSDYELERRENIRRNNQVLRDLGLDEDPLVPQRRPPAPRQPRQSRPADGPRRQSSRLHGALRPAYEEEASSRIIFDAETKSTIRTALATSELQGADLEAVYFMSASQLPRDRILTNGVRGDADDLDSRPGSHNILISLKIRDFLRRVGMSYSATMLWKWLALVPGLDVTALVFRGEVVIGAAIGYYSSAENVYLTHVTATHRDLQGDVGVGLFLRREQLRHLAQRLGPGLAPLEVVSLSANADGNSRGAAAFQRHVLEKLGFQELLDAMQVIQRISDAKPELELGRVMRQDVTALRFRHVPVARGGGSAPQRLLKGGVTIG